MNKTIKITLLTIFIVLMIGFFGYLTIIAYAVYELGAGCGFDDGPFHGQSIEPVAHSESAQEYIINNNQRLVVDNRMEEQSPIISLLDNKKAKWVFDTNMANSGGDKNTKIYAIEQVAISHSRKPSKIHLEFIAHWTGGFEKGHMTINLDDGSNEFCLSW